VIASKYCHLYELGQGGMGSVWVAEHLTLRAKVAVKLIRAGLAANADAIRRFEREARAAATLRSAHVVQVLDFGVDGGSPYLAMELLEGESLAARLLRGAMSPQETAVVMEQLGRAMTRAHAEGFVHRDLKPDNVFLVDEGGDICVKVLDFGIAKALRPTLSSNDGALLTADGALLGTPNYMSPEQAQGGSVDARSDIWSLAVIAFECLTGLLPFSGGSLPELLRSICYDDVVVPSSVATVPAGFDAWFLRAVARSPEERPRTVRELVDSLTPILAGNLDDSAFEEPTRPRLSNGPVTFDTFPGEPVERRGEARVPSSIPAAIDGKRDLRHTALIHNASLTGALLATRQRCEPNQVLLLTLHFKGPYEGETVRVHVVRVAPLAQSIWRYEVAVRFETALSREILDELARAPAN
jgi:serine/threonine-protein kinase